MKIFCISDNYENFIYENIEDKISFPFKNHGFNMSFIRINNEEELYIFRNVFTYKSVVENMKIVPGILKKNFNKNIHNITNITDNSIWSWKNYYQTNILFVGSLQENGTIIINNNIKPISLIDPKISYSLPSMMKNIPKSMHSFHREDFRLLKINEKIYMADSMYNMITEIKINDNKIIFGKNNFKYICSYPFDIPYKENNRYYKFFEKNWSFYKSYYDDKKELNLLFLNDYKDGGITYIKYNKNECKKDYILKYIGDYIPSNENEEIRFSFGSNTISLRHNVFLGVGHVKVYFKPKIINPKYQKLYKKCFIIHKSLRHVCKEKYKPHKNRMCFMYFFLLDLNSNSKYKFLISDAFIPIINCDNYVFSLIYPMTIIHKYDKYIISCGYGDYTNVLVSFDLNEIENMLLHDVENFDLKKFNFNLLSEKNDLHSINL